MIIQTNERKKEANVLLKAKNVHTLEINEYRALTRYWPSTTPLWPPCIKEGCLCLAEIGSDFAYLANFSAHQAKQLSQGMPEARQRGPEARQCTVQLQRL